jgi:hypothetical protein
VMIRQSLAANSAYAFMFVSRDNGLAFQRRTASGAAATHTEGGPGVAPRWVRLTRAGNVVTARVSVDGAAWTTVGSDTLSISGPVHVGLAVTSHDTSQLAAGSFDGVTVR